MTNAAAPQPKKPHWKRREQVYAVLSQAPAGASYSQLVAWVRQKTGKGCSRKLISQWKRTKTVISNQLPVTEKQKVTGHCSLVTEKLVTEKFRAKSTDSQRKVYSPVDKSMDMSRQVYGQVEKFVDERVDESVDERKQTAANTKPITLTDQTTTRKPNTSFQPIQLNLLPGLSRFIATLLLSCSILLGLSFLTPKRPKKVTAQNPSATIPTPPSKESNSDPRRIKIQLTLASPTDLKVKEEQEISAGQVLSDRSSERTRLRNQRQQLALSLQKLNISLPPLQTPTPIAELRPLPITSFQAEQAAIALKQQEVKSAEKRIKNQKSKINEFKSLENNHSSPNNPDISLIIAHETAILSQLKQEQLKAIKTLEIAKSRLTSAQESRQQAEYHHYLEASQRAIALQNQQIELERQRTIRAGQQQEREYSRAALKAKIQAIDNAISQLSTVKAPYSGIIRRIKWQGQNNHQISVELTLDLGNRSPRPNAASLPQ